jgi:hypothetical protein
MSRNAVLCVSALTLSLLAGCSTTAEVASYLPEDTKIIVRFLANDLPLPDNSSVKRTGTVITGSGSNWAGRLELTAPQTPGQLMRFFAEGVVGAGWTLKATTVSSTIILVIEKDGRVGAIEIADSRPVISQGGLLGGLSAGTTGNSNETDVRISVNHKDAVQDQAPFEGGTLLSQVLFNSPAPNRVAPETQTIEARTIEPATTLSAAALTPQ